MPSVCNVITSINQDIGGPAVVVPAFAEILAEGGIDSHLLTLDYSHRGPQVEIDPQVCLHSYPTSLFSSKLGGISFEAAQQLDFLSCHQLDIVHSHSLWLFLNFYARKAALKNNLPLIISPHGALEPWSLSQNSLKKRFVWSLCEYKNLKSASLFHATSKQEAQSIRNLGFGQPIAVIPNGVSNELLTSTGSRKKLETQFPKCKDKRWLLFLSRLHSKKGVDTLILVWKELAKYYPEWHLIIAGPDRSGYKSTLEGLAADIGVSESLTFTDLLAGELKLSALYNSDVFVLPTHSENFGIAIAEALGCGTPVITTKNAPWNELITTRSGWWIDDSRSSLLEALTEAMNLSESELSAMGQRGRELIIQKYSWNAIAKKLMQTYKWILNKESLPDFIIT